MAGTVRCFAFSGQSHSLFWRQEGGPSAPALCSRAGASKSGAGKDFQVITGVKGALQSLVLCAPSVRLLLPQQADGQPADGGEVGRAIAVLLAA